MRNTALAAALTALFLAPTGANAQAPAPAAAPASPHTLTGNLALVTDYRFRGISQTYKLPAVQGGIDYAHASGFYLGTWASNVSGNMYPNGAGLEWDFYGGYKGSLSGDLGFDVGLLAYWYPGAYYNVPTKDKFNNTELYAALTYKWMSLKYSHTLSDFFGVKNNTYGGACQSGLTGDATDCFAAAPGNSRGSGYLDFTANYPINDKLTLVGHIGHQSVRHYGKLNYTDWKLGVNYDLNGWVLGAAYVDTNAKKGWYTVTEPGSPSNYKKVGDATLVLSVSKSF